MATIAEVFDLAVRYHKSGNLGQAEPLYRQILQAEPGHAVAHHFLGLLAHQAGQHDAAIALLRRAIALTPADAGCHSNLGIILMSQGQVAEAALCFRQALRLAPLDVDAHINLGSALKDQGQLAEAIACFRQALSINPLRPDAYVNLGAALKDQGQPHEARECYRRALELDRGSATAHYNLGNILKDRGEMAEAAQCYRQALANNPDHADAYNNLGIILKNQGQTAQAVACYQQALRVNPGNTDAHNNLGIVLLEQGQRDDAVQCFRRALSKNPRLADVHLNLGNALKDQGQFAEAMECYRQALRLNPGHADAHHNLGIALWEQGEIESAVESYRHALDVSPRNADAHDSLSIALARLGRFREALEHNDEALQIKPDHASAHWQRARLRLAHGDFAGGWEDYEYRWLMPGVAPRPFQQPRWDGSSLEGKTILVHVEQGLGDTIQFVRYLPLVKERGGTVLFGCQPGLESLMAGISGADQVIASGGVLHPFDVQVPLLSLPGIFGTTPTTIPAKVPYVRADRVRVERWANELEPWGGFRVGIAWRGNPENRVDRYRSISLTRFECLARVETVRLVSLQAGPGTEQLATAPFAITDLGSRFDPSSLDDLAAALVNVDLVVTVDTAVAHLAGALGVAVWTLLPLSPDWRWLLERADSPWYPTMRLFRQSRFDDWEEVVGRVAAELRLLIARKTIGGTKK